MSVGGSECMCVCVRARERETQRQRKVMCVREGGRGSECVCVDGWLPEDKK